jgi:DNA repair protein RAD50
MEIEKKHLETYKSRSDQLKRELDENKQKQDSLVKKKEGLIEMLKPIEKKLNFFLQESAKIFEIKTELGKIENEKILLEKQIKELLQATQDCLFNGSDAELKDYIQNFNKTTNQMRKDEEESINKKINSLNSKQREIIDKKSNFMVEMGSLESKYKVYNEKRSELTDLTFKAQKICDIDTHLIKTLNKEHIFLNINKLIDDIKQIIKTTQENFKNFEQKFQENIDNERDNKSKLDQNITNKTEIIKKCKFQIEQIAQELKIITNDKVLNDLNEKIKDIESEIRNLTDNLKETDELNTKIEQLENEKNNLKRRESLINNRINTIHTNSKFQFELDLLNKDKDTKIDQIRKIRYHINQDIDSFFFQNDVSNNSINDTNLKMMFEKESRELTKKLTEYENKQKDVEKQLFSHDLKRKNDLETIRLKESEMKECENIILNELVGYINDENDLERYDEILDELKEKHKSIIDEKGYIGGVEKTYKRFLSELTNKSKKSASTPNIDNHSCPVCLRFFKSEDELNETICQVNKYTNKLPSKTAELENKLVEIESKLSKMIDMRSFKDKYNKLKSEEIDKLRKQVETYDRSVLPKLKSELKEINQELSKLQSRKAISEQLQNDIVLIDKYINECNELDKKIIASKQKLSIQEEPNFSSNKENVENNYASIEKLNQEKKEIEDKFCKLNESIGENRTLLAENYKIVDKLNNFKENLNEYKSKRNDIMFKTQKKSQLLEKQMDLDNELNDNQKEINQLKTRLQESSQKIDSMTKDRQEKCFQHETFLKDNTQKLNEVSELKLRLEELYKIINNFEENDQSKMKSLNDEIKLVETQIKQINNEIETNRIKLDDVKSQLARFEIKQRQLYDNLKLREKRIEFDMVNKKFTEKKEELHLKDSDLDFSNFNTEQKKYETKRDELNKELNNIKTLINVLNGKLEQLNEEANIENYKNALEQYLICSSDLRVLELAVSDIDKYYKALDRAIMNYHVIKMNEINKTIKQLWRQVYRGNDIDYIEIRSEEEGQNEEEIKAKRVYNYRVVLIKGDTQLDMRGRCSAGQKVLASIIIRLALAETFCLNSGILALDEPTTNLDRENIESLASALVE